jgi:hypothetical protein
MKMKMMKTISYLILVLIMLTLMSLSVTASANCNCVTLGNSKVGSVVSFIVGDEQREFIVVQQGSPSEMYHGFEGGTVLLMRDVLGNRRWHSTTINNYENSEIHAWLNNEFFNTIDVNIRNDIRQVRVPFHLRFATPELRIGENGVQCRVFLLSGMEVGNGAGVSLPNDGTTFTYFTEIENGNATDSRIGLRNGTAAVWWLRSPLTNGNEWTRFVNVNGGIAHARVTDSQGIRPALVLPSMYTANGDGEVVAACICPPATSTGTVTTTPTDSEKNEEDEEVAEILKSIYKLQNIFFILALTVGIIYFLFKVVMWFI